MVYMHRVEDKEKIYKYIHVSLAIIMDVDDSRMLTPFFCRVCY